MLRSIFYSKVFLCILIDFLLRNDYERSTGHLPSGSATSIRVACGAAWTKSGPQKIEWPLHSVNKCLIDAARCLKVSYWHYIVSKSVLLTLYSDHSILWGTRCRPRSASGLSSCSTEVRRQNRSVGSKQSLRRCFLNFFSNLIMQNVERGSQCPLQELR